MRLVLSSVLLGLAWFGAINIAGTIVASLMGRAAIAGGVRHASLLLSIRLLPAAASVFFVSAIFLPAHWRFEEANTRESFGLVLGAIAVVAASVLLRSVFRAIHTAWRGHRLLVAARRTATPLADCNALAVRGLRGVSLAGVLRPQILVGRDALDALSAAELDAAISHEVAHRRSRDNLKRFLLHCSPDLFGLLPIARRLEARWEAEAECQADAAAVGGDDRRGVVLASALVKVARLKSRGATIVPTPAWSAFHVPTLLEMRVRRLVGGNAIERSPNRPLWTPLAFAAPTAAVVIWLADLSYGLHLITEALVTHLP